MMSARTLLASLSGAGIKIDVADNRLRLTGNLAALTDGLRETLRKQKSELLELLSDRPIYPNSEGLVKCDYCAHLAGYRCTEGHRPDGLALLRECVDFSFKRKD